MKTSVAMAALVCIAFGPLQPADAASVPTCGAKSPTTYVTLGAVSIKGRKPQPRSAQAIAAIVRLQSATPVAWMTWDEFGIPWIVLAEDSPKALFDMTKMNYFQALSDVKIGARIFALPGAVVTLPTGYALAACTADLH